MTDIVTRAARSRMMAGIRGKNTRPEILVRTGLHRRGFRYRLHGPHLPGKPDMVLPRWRAVILVHGCFWHGHDCHLFRWPGSRPKFWKNKITRSRIRDMEVRDALAAAGWRTLTIWECSLRGREKLPLEKLLREAGMWLRKKKTTPSYEIRGLRHARR